MCSNSLVRSSIFPVNQTYCDSGCSLQNWGFYVVEGLKYGCYRWKMWPMLLSKFREFRLSSTFVFWSWNFERLFMISSNLQAKNDEFFQITAQKFTNFQISGHSTFKHKLYATAQEKRIFNVLSWHKLATFTIFFGVVNEGNIFDIKKGQ